jgi:sec-independent protein translocase protein TatA
MPDLGPAELVIVLLIVVLVFGGTRLAEVGGSLGKGIKDFRKAMQEDDEVAPATASQASPAPAALPAGSIACRDCGTVNANAARFCSECGAELTAGPAPVANSSTASEA